MQISKGEEFFHIRWIRGHSGDVVNGIADRLADAGTREESQHRWWRRCPLLGGWDEEGFIKNVVNIHRETTVCQEALETRWTGPTDFSRTNTASHKLFRHWRHSQQPSPNQLLLGEPRGKAAPKQHDPADGSAKTLCRTSLRKGSPEEKKDCPSHYTKLDR